jgi:hypothetical protein
LAELSRLIPAQDVGCSHLVPMTDIPTCGAGIPPALGFVAMATGWIGACLARVGFVEKHHGDAQGSRLVGDILAQLAMRPIADLLPLRPTEPAGAFAHCAVCRRFPDLGFVCDIAHIADHDNVCLHRLGFLDDGSAHFVQHIPLPCLGLRLQTFATVGELLPAA